MALALIGDRVVDVVRDVQIEQPIAIEIEESRARAPGAAAGDAGRLGDVGKGPVAVVAEQLVGRAEMGDEHVDESVVVDIAGRDPHAVAARAQPGSLGDVGEFERHRSAGGGNRLVAEEACRALRRACGGGMRSHQGSALQHEQVETPVVVVIEQGDAGTDDLGKIELAAHSVRVDEASPRWIGHLDEGNLQRLCPF